MKNNSKKLAKLCGIIAVTIVAVVGIFKFGLPEGALKSNLSGMNGSHVEDYFDLSDVPEYTGSPYVEVNDNEPFFTDDELTTDSFEEYSKLDSLGRCGEAYACIGEDIMPTEKRGSIGQVKPAGWHTVRYDDLIKDKYLYNRCHLIAFELAAENANERNLITGTRYMNVEGMLPFENKVADYVKSTGNHVLYRVTPIYEDENLLADGVLIESESVEDKGKGICFNVYCYNVQPYIEIDYKTGDSQRAEGTSSSVSSNNSSSSSSNSSVSGNYVLNTNTKKFHLKDCSSVSSMKKKNTKTYSGSRDNLINQGYSPCKNCNP